MSKNHMIQPVFSLLNADSTGVCSQCSGPSSQSVKTRSAVREVCSNRRCVRKALNTVKAVERDERRRDSRPLFPTLE